MNAKVFTSIVKEINDIEIRLSHFKARKSNPARRLEQEKLNARLVALNWVLEIADEDLPNVTL